MFRLDTQCQPKIEAITVTRRTLKSVWFNYTFRNTERPTERMELLETRSHKYYDSFDEAKAEGRKIYDEKIINGMRNLLENELGLEEFAQLTEKAVLAK